MTLGSRIKALRYERGWSQRELGRQAGVRYPLISRLERGVQQGTSGSVLDRLARALDVSVDYLLGRTRRRRLGADDPLMRSAGGRTRLVGTTALLRTNPL